MKKGQATAFIILGVILLGLVGTLYYFRADIIDTFGQGALTETPTIQEIENVRRFTQGCVEDALITGTDILGMQGGYIILPDDEFPPAQYNILSNSVDMFGDGSFKVPYWSYLTPNSLERIQVPSRQEMELELSNYITRETKVCLNDYLQFKLQGYDIVYSDPTTKVQIGDEVIITEVKMPIYIGYKDISQNYDKFKVTYDVPLGKLHAEAIELFEYESNSGFLENFTLETMAMYDEIPYSGVDFDCTPRTWLRSKVIQDLKSILALNIPTLKIKNTDYSLRNSNDNVLVFDALKSKNKDLTVSFLFARNWPIMIDIIGEDSELLRGKPFTTDNEASRFLLPLFCLNDYHFVYDIKYPLIATLTENGYTFQYGIMGVIDNNQPKRNNVIVPQFDEDNQVCNNKDIPGKIIASGIAADGTSVPMNQVDIVLNCALSNCKIGTTKQETSGSSLTSLLPQCIGGELIATKQGYHRATTTIDTTSEGTYFVSLEPYYELSVNVMINDEGSFRAPLPTESIYFQFENDDQEYYTSYIYPSDEKLKLVAGNYHVASTLMVETQQGFKLKEEEIEICSDVPSSGLAGLAGLKEKKCSKQKVDAMDLNVIVAGGGSITWYADRRTLATSSKINLYSYRGSTPTTFTQLNEVYQNQEKFSKNLNKPSLE